MYAVSHVTFYCSFSVFQVIFVRLLHRHVTFYNIFYMCLYYNYIL